MMNIQTTCEGAFIQVDTKDKIISMEKISDDQFVTYSLSKVRLWDLKQQ